MSKQSRGSVIQNNGRIKKNIKAAGNLKDGELVLKSGSKVNRLFNLFYNPNQPELDDYYEPWTYDYETLTESPEKQYQPVARAKSQLQVNLWTLNGDQTGKMTWPVDILPGLRDPNVVKMEESIKTEFEDVFMMYLPRICEHCINAPCVSSCPSGAMYKRDEDGIVLVDQNACRAWRHCVTSLPI